LPRARTAGKQKIAAHEIFVPILLPIPLLPVASLRLLQIKDKQNRNKKSIGDVLFLA
jgi:hypothetical protein